MERKTDRCNWAIRPLTEAEIESNRASARGYLHAAEQYRKG